MRWPDCGAPSFWVFLQRCVVALARKYPAQPVPMVVVFAGLYESVAGSHTLVFTAVVLAGLLQILFALLRLGQFIRLVPYPVISGFMSGIGCIIVVLQLPRLLGHEPVGGGTLNALKSLPDAFCCNQFTGAVYWIGQLGSGFLLATILESLCTLRIGCSDVWHVIKPCC